MASGPRGVLYVGMTSDLAGRSWKHRGACSTAAKRYWVDRPVYFERYDNVLSLLARARHEDGGATGRSS
jgi:putative endonuclease